MTEGEPRQQEQFEGLQSKEQIRQYVENARLIWERFGETPEQVKSKMANALKTIYEIQLQSALAGLIYMKVRTSPLDGVWNRLAQPALNEIVQEMRQRCSLVAQEFKIEFSDDRKFNVFDL